VGLLRQKTCDHPEFGFLADKGLPLGFLFFILTRLRGATTKKWNGRAQHALPSRGESARPAEQPRAGCKAPVARPHPANGCHSCWHLEGYHQYERGSSAQHNARCVDIWNQGQQQQDPVVGVHSRSHGRVRRAGEGASGFVCCMCIVSFILCFGMAPHKHAYGLY
jgi:hypothetical protein